MRKISGSKKSTKLTFIPVQLCKPGKTPSGEQWLHEIKLDGYRIEAIIDGKNVKLITRNQKDFSDKFTAIRDALKRYPRKRAILDGEIVALDKQGISRFQDLQNALDKKKSEQLIYYVFDILHCDGYDLTNAPLLKRKTLLREQFDAWQDKPFLIHLTDFIEGEGPRVFSEACSYGLEGIISKRIDSIYDSRRSGSWIKAKCILEQEFVIGGFTDPKGSRGFFGALLLGYYKDGQLIYCGNVGTGFNEETLKKLYGLLKPRQRETSPFVDLFARKSVHWVKPELVANIRFSEWTKDNILRQPVFLGLRHDKSAKDVTVFQEEKRKPPKAKKKVDQGLIKRKNFLEVAEVTITNPKKILYSNPPLTKSDLAHFYEEISDWILPHVINRPLTLYRCPNGIDETCFFQKHFTASLPDGVLSVKVPMENEPYVMIEDKKGLLGLVQMGVLEIHPWNCQKKSLDKPDRIIFDLDPASDVPLKDLRACAMNLRRLLLAFDLTCFVKTTGGKGLHIVVPIIADKNYEHVLAFIEALAQLLVDQNPKKYTLSMSKLKRTGKIFIDYHRNHQGSTAIAPYSLRARVLAPIATPISWAELTRIKPQQYTIENLAKRLKRIKKDPWEGFFSIKQKLPKVAK